MPQYLFMFSFNDFFFQYFISLGQVFVALFSNWLSRNFSLVGLFIFLRYPFLLSFFFCLCNLLNFLTLLFSFIRYLSSTFFHLHFPLFSFALFFSLVMWYFPLFSPISILTLVILVYCFIKTLTSMPFFSFSPLVLSSSFPCPFHL